MDKNCTKRGVTSPRDDKPIATRRHAMLRDMTRRDTTRHDATRGVVRDKDGVVSRDSMRAEPDIIKRYRTKQPSYILEP